MPPPEIKEANVPGDLRLGRRCPHQPPAPYIFSTALTASIESYAGGLPTKGRQEDRRRVQRDAWGRDRYQQVKEALKKAGIQPVADEELAPDSNEATPQVLRIKQAGADAVIMVLYPKAAASSCATPPR